MKFNLGKLGKALGPVIAIALAAGASGCDGHVTINGEGKPLAELDMSGAAPQELVLAGPDEVHVTTGDKLAISVEGDPAVKDELRFALKDGSLAIHRKDGSEKIRFDTAAEVLDALEARFHIDVADLGDRDVVEARVGQVLDA